jgi:hypothetical protein
VTQEEKYINFMLNYNKKLKERDDIWLGPKDIGDVILQTAEQNEPGCIDKIISEYNDMRNRSN